MRVNMMMHHMHNNNVISRTHLIKSSELKKEEDNKAREIQSIWP